MIAATETALEEVLPSHRDSISSVATTALTIFSDSATMTDLEPTVVKPIMVSKAINTEGVVRSVSSSKPVAVKPDLEPVKAPPQMTMVAPVAPMAPTKMSALSKKSGLEIKPVLEINERLSLMSE